MRKLLKSEDPPDIHSRCCRKLGNRKMKVIDATIAWGNIPIIGKKKEKWLFRCNFCNYKAIFILYENDGMSTGCERCLRGDMERIRKIDESP